MCDSCSKIFNDECLKETTKLREYLQKEEKKIASYMSKIVKLITAQRDIKLENHDCQKSRLRVLGVAKVKALGLYTKPPRKSKAKRVRRTPNPGWWVDSRDATIHYSKTEVGNQF